MLDLSEHVACPAVGPGKCHVDTVKVGIIDPLKVIRTALIGAAHMCSMRTTTEYIIAEFPKNGKETSAMGGGMDY